MAGGLLQLVASGPDNIYLTTTPEITLFKNIYRRHTNFAQYPKKIKFPRDLNYGSTSSTVLPHCGDLVGQITLYLHFDTIDLQFPIITNQKMAEILEPYGIIYEYTGSPTHVVTQQEYTDIQVLINNEIDILIQELADEQYKRSVVVSEYSNSTTNGRDYANSVFPILITGDQYEILYNYIVAYQKDIITPYNISNFDDILTQFYNSMITKLIITDPTYIYIYDNIVFTHVIEFGSYVFNQSILNYQMKTIFDKVVQSGYALAALNTGIDSYKIYINYFNNLSGLRSIITSQNDIISIRDDLLNNIKWNNRKNLNQIINIMVLLQRNSYDNSQQFRIGLYKKIKYITTTIYDATDPMNLVNSSIDPQLNDYFTSVLQVPTSIGETSTVINFYGNFVTTAIQTLNTTLRDLFRNTSYTDYLNDRNIWKRLIMSTYFGATPATYGDLDNLYLMNVIPMYIVDDIPDMVYTLLSQDINLNSYATLFDLRSSSFSTALHAVIDDMYLAYDDGSNSSIKKYITAVNADYRGGGSNKVLLALFNPSLILSVDTSPYTPEVITDVNEQILTDLLPIEYVIINYVYKYTQLIYDNTTGPSGVDTSLRTTLVNFIITEIVNRFRMTPIAAYENYKNNNFSLFKIDSLNLAAGGAIEPAYLDAASSIWYAIQKDMISSFNTLFQASILSESYYINSLGLNMTQALDFFKTLLVNNGYPSNVGTLNYYTFRTNQPSPNTLVDLVNTYNNMYNTYNSILNLYDQQKNLFLIKYITTNKSRNYYRSFQDIFNILKNEILNNPDKYYPPLYNSASYVGVNVPQLLSDIENDLVALNLIGMIDKKYSFRNELITAINNALINNNPYLIYTNLYNWFVQYQSQVNNNLLNQFDTIISFVNDLDSFNQYNEPNRATTYNNFKTDVNFVVYMSDLVVRSSSIAIFSEQIVESKTQTYINFLLIIDTNILNITKTLAVISLNGDYTGSKLEIQLTKLINGGQPAAGFCKELGFRIIEKISLLIGGDVIDFHTDELFRLGYMLKHSNTKLPVFFKMIGNIPQVYEYNNSIKGNFTLQIPLQFFFNRHVTSFLPIVAMRFTDIEIKVKLRDYTDVLVWDTDAFFVKKPKISNAHLVAEYIYVDKPERFRLTNEKHQYLVELWQHSTGITFNKDNIVDGKLYKQVYFRNQSKLLVWSMKFIKTNLVETIGGTPVSVKDQIFDWTNNDLVINNKIIKTIEKIELKMNGTVREIEKESGYYELVQPYTRNCDSLNNNICMYSFAIDPSNLQPSGQANFSFIGEFVILITLTPYVYDLVINDKIQIVWNTYNFSYNWLRVTSGMAALAYN